MAGIIKRYMDLQVEIQKLENSIDFVYVYKEDRTEHSQFIEKMQKDFLWRLGFSLVSDDEMLANKPAFKFAAPEKMEHGVVHKIRCKLLLIERDIIANNFDSLDVYDF